MNLDEIREALFGAMDNQLASDTAASEESYKLGQQKIMYNNDARGSLYSGQPTWERAQLAASHLSDIADINNKYLKQKLSIWDNITNTLDQINSYNKAANAMKRAAGNTSSSSGNGNTAQQFLDLYNSLHGGE